jgi:Iron/zinc purple acid phosphatase-like protein C
MLNPQISCSSVSQHDCSTLQVPYCTPQQPDWSAYREDAFGHGILEIKVRDLFS